MYPCLISGRDNKIRGLSFNLGMPPYYYQNIKMRSWGFINALTALSCDAFYKKVPINRRLVLVSLMKKNMVPRLKPEKDEARITLRKIRSK